MKVSVIVPVYNSEKYLKTCLDSLVKQSLDEIEIIAVDDASNDQSFKIMKEYSKKYPIKVKVLHNDRNIGQGASRNRGLAIAQGEYIGFVDSDDYVNLSMYKELYEKAVAHDYPDVICTKLIFVKGDEYFKQNLDYARVNHDISDSPLKDSSFILEDSPSSCNKLFKRSYIQGNTFLETSMWEDFAFTYSCLLNANQVLINHSPNYFYRKRETEGVSSRGKRVNSHILDCFAVADEIESQTKKSGRFFLLEEQIRLLQSIICLERIPEILTWDIEEDKRQSLCIEISDLVKKKYGDWEKLDEMELFSRVGYFELEKLKDFLYQRDSRMNIQKHTNKFSKIIKRKITNPQKEQN